MPRFLLQPSFQNLTATKQQQNSLTSLQQTPEYHSVNGIHLKMQEQHEISSYLVQSIAPLSRIETGWCHYHQPAGISAKIFLHCLVIAFLVFSTLLSSQLTTTVLSINMIK